ncbi:MAG: 50S ribosomal protein L29 [Patescibacteria group bacterium]|nr:50S ribosomal protein L29 [Patescibacteria group bacterium]
MKRKELIQVNIENLEDMVSLKKSELLKLKLDLSKGQNEGDIRKIRKGKRELAQILTIIKEKKQHDK